MKNGENFWRQLYNRVNYGDLVESRYGTTKEVTCLQAEVLCPFDWHAERKLNLDYLRREFQWYLNGDPADLRICEHAKIWSGVVNRDRTLSSNYGYYWFTRGGLAKAVQILKNDWAARHAVMSVYNQFEHSKPGIKDVPCTCSVGFMIRSGKLHMHVHMRSNDVVYGLGNDLPIFHWVHRLAYWLLKEKYEDLKMGRHVHRADSFHVYERHFDLAQDIAMERGSWEPEGIPDIVSTADAKGIIEGKSTRSMFNSWLHEVSL